MSDQRRPDDSLDLPLELTRQIDALCDEFEAAIAQGSRPQLAVYADRCPQECRDALLRELVLLWVEARQQDGAAAAGEQLLVENPAYQTHLSAILAELDDVLRPVPSNSRADDHATSVGLDSADHSAHGLDGTIDFDASGAATVDSDQVPLRCSNCDSMVVVDVKSDSQIASCPRCRAPLPSAQRAQDNTPNRGSHPTVDLRTGAGADDRRHSWMLAGGERFSKLNLHAVGGLGEVYLARDEQLAREVALKELQDRHADAPEKRDRFVFEGQVTGKLEHPGIVPVYSLGVDANGRPFYTMRFVRGRSLAKAVKALHRDANLQIHPSHSGLRSVLQSFIAACHAIEYAHSRGVLHCDLKPDNIMVGKFGETYVVDWGMARVQGDALVAYKSDGETPIAPLPVGSDGRVGSAMGTPAFMSPEQAVGDLPHLAEATDIFSLGATLFQILTSVPPYSGSTLTDVLAQAASTSYRRPREISPRIPRALEAVCLKAMAERPCDRYASARQLGDDVDRWLGDEPLRAYHDTWFDRMRRFGRRNRALVASAAAAVMLVAVVSTAAAVAVNRARIEQKRLANRNEKLATLEAEARAKAEERFERARETVDVWLTGFTEAIGQYPQYPGMTALRRTMLTRAAEEYERFANEELTGPELREERARTLIRLGNLRRDLGELPGAVAAYRAAMDTIDEHSADGELTPSLAVERSRALERIGLTLADQAENEAAEAAFRESIRGQEELADGASADPADAVSVLAAAHIGLAGLLVKLERFEEAQREYQTAVKRASRKVNDAATAAILGELVATAQNGLGQVALARGNSARAEEHLQDAIATLATLWQRSNGDAAARERLAVARLSLAAALAAKGDLQGQAEQTESALADLSWLAAAYPEIVRFRERAAEARTNLGLLRIELGEFAVAEESLVAAAEAQRQLVIDFPVNLNYVRDYAVSLDNIAQLRLLTGAYGEAIVAGDEAARILTELLAPDVDWAGARERLAVVESHRAQALWDLEQYGQALKLFQAASGLAREVAQTADLATSLLPNLALIEARYGDALHASGDIQAAQQHWRIAAGYWDQWYAASSDGRAAGQAANFLLTCPDERSADAAGALTLALVARRQAPQSRYFAALAAIAQANLGEQQEAEQSIAPFAVDETATAVADREGAWLLAAAAVVNSRGGRNELAATQLEQVRSWEREQAPGDWELRALRAFVESTLGESAGTASENSSDSLKPDDDPADQID